VINYLERLKAELQENPPAEQLPKLPKVFSDPGNTHTTVTVKTVKRAFGSFDSSYGRHVLQTDDAHGRLEELAALPCPDDVSPARWEGIRAGALRFAREWAGQAIALGWTFDEIFASAEPFANGSLQGAAWFIGDSTVTAVTADAITLRTEGGATQRVYRRAGL
jgi:hypothetical protein